MCHYPPTYRTNVRTSYQAHQFPNTYWRLKFEIKGDWESISFSYNNGLVSANFVNQVQTIMDPYGIKVETITFKIPNAHYSNTSSSEMIIANQRDFLRALNLITCSPEVYSPNRGIEAYINKDKVADKKSETDSGYNSETSNQ